MTPSILLHARPWHDEYCDGHLTIETIIETPHLQPNELHGSLKDVSLVSYYYTSAFLHI